MLRNTCLSDCFVAAYYRILEKPNVYQGIRSMALRMFIDSETKSGASITLE